MKHTDSQLQAPNLMHVQFPHQVPNFGIQDKQNSKNLINFIYIYQIFK